MRAAVYNRYGPPEVVQVADVPKPEPKRGEALIRVLATTVTSADRRLRALDVPAGFGPMVRLLFGVFRPRHPILGRELAGTVEAVGEGVSELRPGDEVFGYLGGIRMGCHAEYAALPEESLAPKPANLSFQEAAAISFGGNTALVFLRDMGKIQRGERALIVGASGAVGSSAVQLAKYFGAEVTAVTSGPNVELVRSLGADHVIDYIREDFTQRSQTYDLIFDTVGATSFAACRHCLAPNGRLLLAVAGPGEMLSAALRKSVLTGDATGGPENLALLRELCEAGAYRPLIDRTYALERIAEAHAYVDTGRKKGSVIVTP